jgi:uncharacterized protein YraI
MYRVVAVSCVGWLLALGLFVAVPRVAEARPALVTDDIYVRGGPGVEYPVVGTADTGNAVDVLGCASSWCQINLGGRGGFISRQFLDFGGSLLRRRAARRPYMGAISPPGNHVRRPENRLPKVVRRPPHTAPVVPSQKPPAMATPPAAAMPPTKVVPPTAKPPVATPPSAVAPAAPPAPPPQQKPNSDPPKNRPEISL